VRAARCRPRPVTVCWARLPIHIGCGRARNRPAGRWHSQRPCVPAALAARAQPALPLPRHQLTRSCHVTPGGAWSPIICCPIRSRSATCGLARAVTLPACLCHRPVMRLPRFVVMYHTPPKDQNTSPLTWATCRCPVNPNGYQSVSMGAAAGRSPTAGEREQQAPPRVGPPSATLAGDLQIARQRLDLALWRLIKGHRRASGTAASILAGWLSGTDPPRSLRRLTAHLFSVAARTSVQASYPLE
jgi:hypothetical protein